MPDEERKISIPAAIRSLLEPYRIIMGPHDGPKEEKKLEVTFLPEYERPDDEQLRAIGKVAATWAVLERMLGLIVTRLALAPEFPGMALTKDLGLDYQIKAAKALITLHKNRYRCEIIGSDWLVVISNMLRRFISLRQERNIVVHTVWYRFGDKLSSLPSRPMTSTGLEENPRPERTVGQLQKLAADIQELADAMFVAVQHLPEVDERQHAKSLALRKRPPLPGAP
jgi:hypothetical protein